MFVRGGQIEAVLKRFPEVARFRAVVTREGHVDHLAYEIEVPSPGTAGLAEAIGEALTAEIKVRGEVKLLPPGSIPAGGKKVDDQRVWK